MTFSHDPVALTPDFRDVAVVQHDRGDDGVSQVFTPFLEALVGRRDGGAPFVGQGDGLKKEMPASWS